MAMTFTLVSHLREKLSTLVHARYEHHKQEEAEKERLVVEVWFCTITIGMPFDFLFFCTCICRQKKPKLEVHLSPQSHS